MRRAKRHDKPNTHYEAKDPNDAGMLQMVPLKESDVDDLETNQPKKSATSFFAIPKGRRAKEDPSTKRPALPSAPGVPLIGQSPPGMQPGMHPGMQPGMHPGMHPGMQPGMHPGMQPGMHPGMQPGMHPGMGPPMGPGGYGYPGGAPLGIQGPVAGGAMAGGMVAVADMGDQSQEHQSRTTRVLVILLALFFMAAMAFVVGVAGILLYTQGVFSPTPQPQPLPQPTIEQPKPIDPVDTGTQPEIAPKPVAKPRPKPRPSGGPKPAPKPEPKPSNPGAITVKLTGSAPSSSIQVNCPDGFRGRGNFRSGSATVTGVPPDQSCSIQFKGGPPAKFGGATAGRSYTCEIKPPTAVCR